KTEKDRPTERTPQFRVNQQSVKPSQRDCRPPAQTVSHIFPKRHLFVTSSVHSFFPDEKNLTTHNQPKKTTTSADSFPHWFFAFGGNPRQP
ncbi:MAG TPA: hypothetical protein VNZ25_05570, partial [Candidatus Angelobacter sp.]|nr:hypothetical protein [Candidatus Angelobacter sp.]